jgi:hypothetical protein
MTTDPVEPKNETPDEKALLKPGASGWPSRTTRIFM